jgi:hypothetical protein
MGQTFEWKWKRCKDVQRYQTKRSAWEELFCVTALDDTHSKQATAPSPLQSSWRCTQTFMFTCVQTAVVTGIKPADRNCRTGFVRKCCRKLTATRFPWTLCVFFWWDDIPFNGVVNNHNCRIWGSQPLKKLSYSRGTRQRFNVWYGTTKDVIIWPFWLSGSNCDKPFVPGHVRTLHSATVVLLCMSPAGWSAPTFWKYCVTF